jgi:tryptophan synthase beta chain
MVRVSYEQKPFRKSMIQAYGAEIVASPSDQTNSGKAHLEKDPKHPGSLGIAISEAVEDAATHDDTKYSLGSVLNHVCLHQTIIGQEAQKQFEKTGDYPDIVVGCCGGGSNFAGVALPFIKEKMDGKDIKIIAVEPASCPSLTKGTYTFDWGDSTKLGPIAKMYTLGSQFVPPGIHAGGLRYHGDSPLICQLFDEGLLEARAPHQLACFEAALMFAKAEGFIIAPETSHAVRAVIDEALECKKTGQAKTILFNNSGHGYFDMAAYDAFLGGQLKDYAYPEEKIKEALQDLPKVEMPG